MHLPSAALLLLSSLSAATALPGFPDDRSFELLTQLNENRLKPFVRYLHMSQALNDIAQAHVDGANEDALEVTALEDLVADKMIEFKQVAMVVDKTTDGLLEKWSAIRKDRAWGYLKVNRLEHVGIGRSGETWAAVFVST